MKFIDNLLKKDLNIVKRKKLWMNIVICILSLALVLGVLGGFIFGSAFNAKYDLAGGYVIDLKLGSRLDDDSFDAYSQRVEEIFASLKDDEGKSFNLKKPSLTLSGTAGSDASLLIKYNAVKFTAARKADMKKDEYMRNVVNVKLAGALSEFFKIAPVAVNYDDANSLAVIEYGEAVLSDFETIREKIIAFSAGHSLGISKDDIKVVADTDNKKISFPLSTANKGLTESVAAAVTINETAEGNMLTGEKLSPSVNYRIWLVSLFALLGFIAFAGVYAAFRFEVSSAVISSIVAVADFAVALSLMLIFRIPLTGAIIPAAAVIVLLSIILSLGFFDKVKENLKALKGKDAEPTAVAETAIKDTLFRTFIVTCAGVISLIVLLCVATPAFRYFITPVAFGFLSSLFTSVCLTPALWASHKNTRLAKGKRAFIEFKPAKPKKKKTQKDQPQNVIND